MQEQIQPSDTILIALDGSLPAQAAAKFAIQIAKAQDLEVHGLYVVDETVVLDTYFDYRAELGRQDEPASRAELVEWFEERGGYALNWLKEQCAASGIPVTTDLLFGGVPELVDREAAQARLLVLGRRGHGHPSDPQHLGRNFRAIAHHSHQPMVIGGDSQEKVQSILLAYADSERARQALKWVTELQRAMPSQVVVFNATSDDGHSEQELSDIRAQVAESGLVDYRLVHWEGQPAAEIVRAAAEFRVGLIAMGGYRHSALVEWVVGSTLDRVLRETALTVLVA
jgi:nucleotide-binding universal stress UspA family protein